MIDAWKLRGGLACMHGALRLRPPPPSLLRCVAFLTLTSGLDAGRAVLSAQELVTAFVNVSVIPMDRERVLAGQTVVVRGARIVALGPAGKVPVPAGAVRVDGQGKFLLPGLADMHVHFATWDLRRNDGMPRFMLDTSVDVADMLFTFVANGVTTVRDMHSGPDAEGNHWLLDVRRRVQAGELVGPRIYAAGDPDESSPEAAAKSVEALKAAGYDFVKLYGRPRPLFDSVIAAARRVGLPVVGHVPDDIGIPGVLRDRWASIEHLFGYLPYAASLDSSHYSASHTTGSSNPGENVTAGTSAPPRRISDAVIRRLAAETRRAGVWNCPTLSAMYIPAQARDSLWPDERVMFDVMGRLVKALSDVGAGLLLGTDARVMGSGNLLNSGFLIHRELETLVELGLTPYQALETGTRNVARFLGTEDSTGTVAVGKRADLVLLKGNPLKDIRSTTALAGVMAGGRWLPRKELERRIDMAVSVVKPGAPVETYGTPAVQMRMLRQLVWR